MDWDLIKDTPPASKGMAPRMSVAQYLNITLNHRFCVISPGDNVATGKVSESVLVGAAGGCLPLLLLPDTPYGGVTYQVRRKHSKFGPPAGYAAPHAKGREGALAHQHNADEPLYDRWLALDSQTREIVGYSQWAWLHRSMTLMLPYTRWLDYCAFAFILPTSVALDHTEGVLHTLDEIDDEKLRQMAEAAKAARPAFVYAAKRKVSAHDANGEESGALAAQDFILAEMCHVASHNKRHNISTNQFSSSRKRPTVTGQHWPQGPKEWPILQATRLSECLVVPRHMEARQNGDRKLSQPNPASYS